MITLGSKQNASQNLASVTQKSFQHYIEMVYYPKYISFIEISASSLFACEMKLADRGKLTICEDDYACLV